MDVGVRGGRAEVIRDLVAEDRLESEGSRRRG